MCKTSILPPLKSIQIRRFRLFHTLLSLGLILCILDELWMMGLMSDSVYTIQQSYSSRISCEAALARNDPLKSHSRSLRQREIAFNEKLKNLIQRGGPGAVARAEKLLLCSLKEFEAEASLLKKKDTRRSTIGKFVRPNHYSFGIVINGYAKIDRDPVSAEKLLNHMEDLAEKRPFLRSDAVKYTSCINAWTRSNRRGAAHKAERLLRRMEQMYYIKGVKQLKPTKVTWASVINCWGKNKERNPKVSGAHRAEQLLKRMEFRFENGDIDIEPDTVCINCVVDAWANCAHRNMEENVPERAERIVQRMIKRYEHGITSYLPDINTYNIILKCWGNSRNEYAPLRCEQILDAMENNSKMEYSPSIRPNSVSYNTVLSAYLKHYGSSSKSMDKSKLILQRMQREVRDGNEDAAPDKVTERIIKEIALYSGR